MVKGHQSKAVCFVQLEQPSHQRSLGITHWLACQRSQHSAAWQGTSCEQSVLWFSHQCSLGITHGLACSQHSTAQHGTKLSSQFGGVTTQLVPQERFSDTLRHAASVLYQSHEDCTNHTRSTQLVVPVHVPVIEPERSNTNTTSRGKHTLFSGPGGITLRAKVPKASPDSGAGGSICTTEIMLSRQTPYCTSRSFSGQAWSGANTWDTCRGVRVLLVRQVVQWQSFLQPMQQCPNASVHCQYQTSCICGRALGSA